MPIEPASLDDMRKDRVLLLQLLGLAHQVDVERFLSELLELVVEGCAATRGYVELTDPTREEAGPHFSLARGFSETEAAQVRRFISRSIIAEALSTGQIVETAEASLDERFRDHESVRQNALQAVMCAPIGIPVVLGVLYLQGPSSGAAFSRGDVERVTIISRHLGPLAERILAIARERLDATQSIRQQLHVPNLVGRSRAFGKVLEGVRVAAGSDVATLLTGPTGAGKTAIAYAIHDNGRRRRGPFVDLNCAAIPENLVESELFGARLGAHSTATRAQGGKVAAAEGGTLFLDELGELPLPAQAKLLQLLDSGTYYPLGASVSCHANIRIIAATNVELDAAVRDGRFRADLFYRIRVLVIAVPALHERREDIRLLALQLMESTCAKHGISPLELSRASSYALESAPWPGNVRQLRNVIEAGIVWAQAEGATMLEPRHLFRDSDATEVGSRPQSWQAATRDFQRDHLLRCLEDQGWNVSRVADCLDLTRSHVYNLIHAFGLRRDD
ncbi:sigma 54-interacting transcriptional regulator [Nannocystaceae bacterium ST9]